jgi:hypothetical protein
MAREPAPDRSHIDRLVGRGDIAAALRQPIVQPKPLAEHLRDALAPGPSDGKDAAFVGALTVGDLAYDLWRIDPEVLKAADFARAGDVHGVLGFSVLADHVLGLSGERLTGTVSQLEGYVGERVAALHLQEMGHVVEFPSAPNQPGWDLLVDGHPFQVKCLDDPSGVLEHFGKYPHIPVIVNEELASQVGSHEHVYTVPGFSHEHVDHLTQSSLHAGEDALDFDVPWISVLVSTARNMPGVVGGHIDPGSAVVNVLTEVAGRTTFGLLGSNACALIGATLGPAGVVFGGMLGAVLGSVEGRKIAAVARRSLAQGQVRRVRVASAELLATALPHVGDKLDAADQQRARVLAQLPSQSAAGPVREYLEHRFEDGRQYFVAKQAEMKVALSEAPHEDVPAAAEHAMKVTVRSAVHPSLLQRQYEKLFRALGALRRRCNALRIG